MRNVVPIVYPMILTPPEINQIANRHVSHARTVYGPEKTILLNKAGTESIAVVIDKIEAWREDQLAAYYKLGEQVDKKISKLWRADHSMRSNANLRPTMVLSEGMDLLVKSRGKCAVCKRQMTYGWVPKDDFQFSFERLNDADTHHADNCQVTCARCNREKMNKYMKCDVDVVNKYRKLKKEYLFSQDADTCQKVVRELANLHWIMHGDTRHNKWQQIKRTRK